MDFKKADINYTPSMWGQYYVLRFIGFIFSYVPGFKKFLAAAQIVLNKLTRSSYSEYAHRINKHKVVGENSTPIEFNSGYGYSSPEEERRVGLMYKAEIISGTYLNKESPILYENIVKNLEEILKNGEIKQVVNFGISYAYIDSLLAQKFPNVTFVGIDRSKEIKKLNEEDFPLPNMKFFAGDVMDWIKGQQSLEQTLFFSMRTCVLLPQTFIEDLYQALTSKNVKMIAGFEPFGISRESNSIYSQEESMKKSALFRDSMYLHNYAGILKKFNYQMSYLDYLKTGHVDADVRIQIFHGVKAN